MQCFPCWKYIYSCKDIRIHLVVCDLWPLPNFRLVSPHLIKVQGCTDDYEIFRCQSFALTLDYWIRIPMMKARNGYKIIHEIRKRRNSYSRKGFLKLYVYWLPAPILTRAKARENRNFIKILSTLWISQQILCMRWPFAFAVHTLCVLHSTKAKDCLLTSPLDFQDQKDGDRKRVTLSGNQMAITPSRSADRLSTILVPSTLCICCHTGL